MCCVYVYVDIYYGLNEYFSCTWCRLVFFCGAFRGPSSVHISILVAFHLLPGDHHSHCHSILQYSSWTASSDIHWGGRTSGVDSNFYYYFYYFFFLRSQRFLFGTISFKKTTCGSPELKGKRY